MILTKEAIKLHSEAVALADRMWQARLSTRSLFPHTSQVDTQRPFVRGSPSCCGIGELSFIHTPGFVLRSPYESKDVLPTGVTKEIFKGSPAEFRKLHLLYLLNIPWEGQGASVRGFVIYHSPPSSGASETLKEIGFSKIGGFANPIHSFREVETWGCHTRYTSEAIHNGQVSWWQDSSSTRRVKTAAAGTM